MSQLLADWQDDEGVNGAEDYLMELSIDDGAIDRMDVYHHTRDAADKLCQEICELQDEAANLGAFADELAAELSVPLCDWLADELAADQPVEENRCVRCKAPAETTEAEGDLCGDCYVALYEIHDEEVAA